MRRSKMFVSRYGGLCGVCSSEYIEGDFICYLEDEIVHEECANDIDGDRVVVPEMTQVTFDPRGF